MFTMKRAAKALSFAHLASTASRAEDQEDDEKKPVDAKGDDDKDYGRKAKKAKAADDEDEDDGAGKDDLPDSDDGDDGGDKKGKSAKKADSEGDEEDAGDGDDEDEEDRDLDMRKSAHAEGRRKERARCAAIFGCESAARNQPLAAHFAFNTNMTSAQAIAALDAVPAGNTRSSRAAHNPAVGADGGRKPGGREAVASSWDRAFAAVNPRRAR